jgi:hypothetical protein
VYEQFVGMNVTRAMSVAGMVWKGWTVGMMTVERLSAELKCGV